MTPASIVLGAVVPVFGIALVGLVIRRLNWLTEEADQSLLRVNINLLYPCLILDAALGNPALSQWTNLVVAPLIGFGTAVLGMAIALWANWLAGLKTPTEQRTFGLTVGLYNYGYVPIPLALLLFGNQTTGVLFIHNVGVETAVWTVGVMLLTGTKWQQDWKQIINPPLVAIALALLLNQAGLNSYLPNSILTGIHLLGQCSIPMALVLIGAVVADHLSQFHSASGWRVIGAAVLLRLGVLPVLFLFLAKILPVSVELKRVIVLQAAMPSAVFPIIMSRHYSGDLPTALRVIIGTSVVGLLTIPIWIRVGLSWVGG
jgi:malate permease and related proteins